MLVIFDLFEDFGFVLMFFFGGIFFVLESGVDSLLVFVKCEVVEKLIMVDLNIWVDFIDDEFVYCVWFIEIVLVVDIVKIFDQDLNWVFEGNELIEEKV